MFSLSLAAAFFLRVFQAEVDHQACLSLCVDSCIRQTQDECTGDCPSAAAMCTSLCACDR